MTYNVISSRGINFKLIRHKGIMYKHEGEIYITHRTEKGTQHETLRSYLAAGREILDYEPHQCESVEQIRAYYNAHANDKFNYFTANCEQYVSDFKLLNNEQVIFRSPQLTTIIFMLLLLAVVLIKTIKRK